MKQTTKIMMLTAILAFCGVSVTLAQESVPFSIATMNIDGLPPKILIFNVNQDGPGAPGTVRIGKYINRQAYDLVMMQEDFNYHQELTAMLEDDYCLDEFSGAVGVESESTGTKVDLFHLQNLKFKCDGLMAAWRNDITVTQMERTAWTDAFGKFSHCNDELITKGFRRYELTMRDGNHIVVYNMHMDASDNLDILDGTDQKDREARQQQWKQLREDILTHIDDRPIIVVGDMNSLYGRDNIQTVFIDAINATGRATASDVWMEMNHAENSADQHLDKIFYINPTASTVSLRPISCKLDTDAYQWEGKPLADHYPLTATFEIIATKASIEDLTDQSSQITNDSEIYDLLGRKVKGDGTKGIFIKRDGSQIHKIIVK